MHRPCKQYPALSTTVYIVSIFSLFFPWFSGYICITYHIWKCAQTMWMVPQHVHNSPHHVYSFFLFFSSFASYIYIDYYTIIGNVHRPCKQLSNITTPSPFFSSFYSYFFIWKRKTCHIWQFLVFIPVTGFQCHSVLVHAGDCSGVNPRIAKFCGRSEILAGKFHWNDTGIHRNDWNLAAIGHHQDLLL